MKCAIRCHQCRYLIVACLMAFATLVATADATGAASHSNRHRGDVSDAAAAPVPPELADEFHLVKVTDPEPTPNDELDHIVSLRESYGLNSDPTFVRALYANPNEYGAVRSGTMMFSNMLVTPPELERLKIRADIEWQAQSATKSVETALGAGYAGVFVEGSSFVVQCSKCDTRSAADSIGLSSFPEPLRSQTEIRSVKYSLEYLNGLERRVDEYLVKSDARINGLGVFVMANRVEVNTGPSSARELGDDLATLFPSEPVTVVPDDGDYQPFVNKDQYLIYGSVEGGQAIYAASGLDGPCTSGFAVQNGYGPFLLTAGHCLIYGTGPWSQGSANLGNEGAWSFGGYMDAGLISTYGTERTVQGHFHRTSSDYFAPVTFVPSDFDALVGTSVCQSGWHWTGMTGDDHPSSRCGIINTVSYDLDSLHGNVGFEPAFIKAGMKGGHGDSGAAIVWPTIYGYGAVSLLSGGPNPDDSPVMSTRMDFVLFLWGLQLTPY